MNQNYIIPDEWSIIEEGFHNEHITASESVFSLGNGAMGQRATFEEIYSGEVAQGDKNFFIDASVHAAGMYRVLVQMGDHKTYKKLMIQ